MSDELLDEIEALNSIYGDGTLVPADDNENDSSKDHSYVYILRLPSGEEDGPQAGSGDSSSSSLRLGFSADYPASPPAVLGVQHSSGGRRGAGARDLELFRDVVGAVFQPGAVCLFDAVEDFQRRRGEELAATAVVEEEQRREAEEAAAAAAAAAASSEWPTTSAPVSGSAPAASAPELSFPPPDWIVSEPFIETRSTFIAHVTRVSSTAQAHHYVAALLASDRRIRSATHNMTAWRIRGPGAATFQDCDDDGEDAAGGRLLHLMQLMDIWGAMVVVTRWYGGVKLGPRRFALINGAARDAFVRAGFVEEGKKKKGK